MNTLDKTSLHLCAAAGCALLILAWAPRLPAQAQSPEQKSPYTSWSQYAGSSDSMQYSALSQINKSNVKKLEPVWFFPVPGGSTRLVFNPIVVDDTMYLLRGRAIVAVNAATGEERWVHNTEGGATSRGISYWESKDRSDRRLIFAGGGALRQISATTGEVVRSFGDGGRVTFRALSPGSPRMLGSPSGTPVRIFEDLIITGSNTGEGYGSPPGDIRAFHVLTGELVWTFRTIPIPGDYGHDSYQNPEAWRYVGGANVWGEITVDAKNGIVFLPTGSPTFDFYGSDRIGDNLFGNCLLALDARTGKRLWHFQTIRHDIWDYDLTAAPKLLTVRHNGEMVEVVAQAGKTGFLYVFHRLTGKPLWPIEDRPVPQSVIPGEVTSPTQPIPTKPPPFARQVFTVEDVNPFATAREQEELREALAEAANDGVFTPPNHLRRQVQFPGAWGGANWGSTTADPETGMLYVRNIEQPSYRIMSRRNPRPPQAEEGGELHQQGRAVFMQYCSMCHGQGMIPMRSPAAVGLEQFRSIVRIGQDQMPGFDEEGLPAPALEALEGFLASLVGRSDPLEEEREDERGIDAPLRLPASPARYPGPPIRYVGNAFAAWWNVGNGLPAIGPPWTTLVAYDLNEGTIKWRIPDGTVPGLVELGYTNTGAFRPRNGPVVTAGGLIFAATSGDRMLRAYDKENGELLWEHELEANPEGTPAIYEVGGRQYIAFPASTGFSYGRAGFTRKTGRIEAQGYHVFALPKE